MNTTPNIFSAKNYVDSILKHGVGFDPRFFERITDTPNFPPHNIVQLSDDEYRLTLAVAGYYEDDLEITLHNDMLTITGKNPKADSSSNILYNGIAFRDFTRQFKIGNHVVVENATLRDGLLIVDLVRRIPDALKPKRIAIANKKPTLTSVSVDDQSDTDRFVAA